MRNVFIAASIATTVLMLAACGPSESPTVTATPVAANPAPAVAAPEENAIGKGLYGKSCALCHAAGMAGAPKPGDKSDWAARIAQGKETLYRHALEGFTGEKGVMPPRGGTTLSDEELKSVVDYMVGVSN